MRFASTIRLLVVLVVALVTAPQALASNGVGDSPSLCCPSDLDGDGEVGSADLADILGAWGPARAGDTADLDDSGDVDAIDIAILLGSWGGCPAPCLKTLVVGSVQLADGTPVADAVVVTELGGQGVSDEAGAFSVEVELLGGTESLTVTAIASIKGTTFTGTKLVSPVIFDGVTDAGVISITASTGCAGEFGWLPGFGVPGLNGPALAMTVFDDGSGPALYVGGIFTTAGGIEANNIARWNGSEWSSLGVGAENGVNGEVRALAVFDDGGGSALYAGGSFTAAGGVTAWGVASWDGASWSPLGTTLETGVAGPVYALAVFDDGSGIGPGLYVGGEFTFVGRVAANRIARWSGSSWSALGAGAANGVTGTVWALAPFHERSGAGPVLVAGGSFTNAGGVIAHRIARWDGDAWSSLGTGPANGVNGSVFALTVLDSESADGPLLIAGGAFLSAGGTSSLRVAQWDGTSWSSLGTGMANGVNATVRALVAVDEETGAGPSLYVGGEFSSAGGVIASRVARWDGSAWTSLGTGATNGVLGMVRALVSFDDGSGVGPLLHVGGGFMKAGGTPANRIARWDGRSWSLVGNNPTNGADGFVRALTVFDDGLGGGPALYAAGHFTRIGGVDANRVARWDGASWSALGDGLANGVNGWVSALAVFDDGLGAGPALYVAGNFTEAGGLPAIRIARWHAGSWSSIGSGAENGVNGAVDALVAVSDGLGGGPELYVGGAFTAAGTVPANRVARWTGASWASLGDGIANGVDGSVEALALFDDGSGSGPAIYAGGSFTEAGGTAASHIARWDGRSWSSLGDGLNDLVHVLAVFDDGIGAGPALYAGGVFTSAGGLPAYRVARWNGMSWSSLGAGPLNGVNDVVFAMTVFDDGTERGPALFVGGRFTFGEGGPLSHVARWDGTSWSPLGSGVSITATSEINALASFASPTRAGTGARQPALYIGGSFTSAGGLPSSNIAVWGCTASRGD